MKYFPISFGIIVFFWKDVGASATSNELQNIEALFQDTDLDQYLELNYFWGRELLKSMRSHRKLRRNNSHSKEMRKIEDEVKESEVVNNFWGRELGKSMKSHHMIRKLDLVSQEMVNLEDEMEFNDFWNRELGKSTKASKHTKSGIKYHKPKSVSKGSKPSKDNKSSKSHHKSNKSESKAGKRSKH